jgi:hypothetical protein
MMAKREQGDGQNLYAQWTEYELTARVYVFKGDL